MVLLFSFHNKTFKRCGNLNWAVKIPEKPISMHIKGLRPNECINLCIKMIQDFDTNNWINWFRSFNFSISHKRLTIRSM